MTIGTIMGVRDVSGVAKNTQRPYRFFELAVRPLPQFVPAGSTGLYVEVFTVFENALDPAYKPSVGDGIRYQLMRQNGALRCLYVLQELSADDPDILSLLS